MMTYGRMSVLCLVGLVTSYLFSLFFDFDPSYLIIGFGLGSLGFQSVRGVWRAGFPYGFFLIVFGFLRDISFNESFPIISYIMGCLGLLFIVLQSIEFIFPNRRLIR